MRINRAGPTVSNDNGATYPFSDCMGTGGGEKGTKANFIPEYSPDTMNILRVPTAHHCQHNLHINITRLVNSDRNAYI